MNTRGRPAGIMTKRRQEVLEQLVASEGRVSLAEVARRCGLHSHNDARRIVTDLKRMGAVG